MVCLYFLEVSCFEDESPCTFMSKRVHGSEVHWVPGVVDYNTNGMSV